MTFAVRTKGVVMAAVAAAGVAALSSCSGSSTTPEQRAAASASASASAVASAQASKFGFTPDPGLGPGVHGPNGNITAPASNAPSKTNPGGSEIFPNVSDKAHHKLQNHMSKFAGVQSVAYYPQFDQLQVYFTAAATAANRQRVYDYVIKHNPQSASAPTPTPTAPATPSASATS